VHCRVFLDGVAIGEHCGSYSEWWLDVPPLKRLRDQGPGGLGPVRRALVVAATTTFNYTQCELVRGGERRALILTSFTESGLTKHSGTRKIIGEGFFLYSGITRSVSWHTLPQSSSLYIDRIEVTPLLLSDGAVSAVLYVNATTIGGGGVGMLILTACCFPEAPIGDRLRLSCIVRCGNYSIIIVRLEASKRTATAVCYGGIRRQ
jgi:hypothetical protein